MATLARPFRLLPLVLLSALATPVAATTLNWITVGNGSAATAANWSPAQVPVAADFLVFDVAGPRTVTFSSGVPSSLQHSYRSGTNTLSFTSPHFASSGVIVGAVNGNNATVNVTTGTLATGTSSSLGNVAGSTGNMTVSGSNVLFQVQNAGADLFVGLSGSGNLTVSGGGIVRVNDDLVVGGNSGAAGTVLVTGSSALNASTLETATADADAIIGNNGNGSLSVASGGVVNVADDMAIAVGNPVNGQLNITGAGSIVTVNDVCTVSNNATAAIAGFGGINVNAGATMVVKDSLRVGDPHGGTGTLHMNGGFLHVKHLAIDAANGVVDWDGGTLRVDGGAATGGDGFSLGSSAGAARLEVIRGASFATGGTLFFSGSGNPGSLALDSGATLNVGGGDLIATNGTFNVTVDSASTLGAGDFQLGGSGSNTSLVVSNGSYVSCGDFESADEAGAVSTISLTGTGSHIDWDNVFYLAGDVGHAGGTADMTIANGGLLRGDGAASAIKIWDGGTMHVNAGGSIETPGPVTIRGLLDLFAGTTTTGTTTLEGTGRIRGRGTVNARVMSSVPATRITATGPDLTLGVNLLGGFVFAGTLEAGSALVTLRNAQSITLGDTTTVQDGRIKSTSSLINPAAGFVRATGAFETPVLQNAGVLSLGGLDPDTLLVQGGFVLPSTSTLRMRIAGTSPNQVDRIRVTAPTTLGGTLELFIDPDGIYPSNTPVTLVTFPTRSGSFTGTVVHGIDPGRVALVVTATSVQVLFLGTVGVDPVAELPQAIAFTGRPAAGASAGGFDLALPRPARVHVALYDVRGRERAVLVDGALPAGVHRSALPAGIHRGVYFGRARIREDGGAGEVIRTDRVLVR